MSQKRQIFIYALAYLLLAISSVFGLLVLNLMRETALLTMVYSASLGEPTSSEQFYQSLRAGAVAQWSIVVIGLIMVILLIGLENLYREGAQNSRLLKGFFLVTAIEAAVLFVTHAIFFALEASFRPWGWMGIMILIVEALLAGLFFWLWHNHQKKAPA